MPDLTTRLAAFLEVLGTGATAPTLTGVLNTSVTAVGNVTTGEDDLITYSLPANSLQSNGQTVRVQAWGTLAGNANAKTFKFYFGAATGISAILAPFATATNLIAGQWMLEALIVRTGSSTQTIISRFSQLNGTTADTRDIVLDRNLVSATETDTAAITIKCTGTGTDTNDVVQSGLLVEGLI